MPVRGQALKSFLLLPWRPAAGAVAAHVVTALLMVVGFLVGPSARSLAAGPVPQAAPGLQHHAGLVVRFGDGHVQTACVAFDEPSLTGEQLLDRSGLRVIINPSGALGGAVCSINDQGCRYPSEDCFCHCTGSQCEYWAYFVWVGSGGWQYSQMGASAVKVADGDLQGWSWGPGNFVSGTEPPKVAFADVCRAGSAPASSGAGGASAPGPASGILQYVLYGVLLLALLGAGAFVVRRHRT
jgi:hypothetical protein